MRNLTVAFHGARPRPGLLRRGGGLPDRFHPRRRGAHAGGDRRRQRDGRGIRPGGGSPRRPSRLAEHRRRPGRGPGADRRLEFEHPLDLRSRGRRGGGEPAPRPRPRHAVRPGRPLHGGGEPLPRRRQRHLPALGRERGRAGRSIRAPGQAERRRRRGLAGACSPAGCVGAPSSGAAPGSSGSTSRTSRRPATPTRARGRCTAASPRPGGQGGPSCWATSPPTATWAAATVAFRGFRTIAGTARVRVAAVKDFVDHDIDTELGLFHAVYNPSLGGRAFSLVGNYTGTHRPR